MLEFAFSTPKKNCLAGASWPLVFAQLSAHVIFKENLVTYSINELSLSESQTVSLCSFFKVSFHSWSGGVELVLASRQAVLPKHQLAILRKQLPSCHTHKTKLTRSGHLFAPTCIRSGGVASPQGSTPLHAQADAQRFPSVGCHLTLLSFASRSQPKRCLDSPAGSRRPQDGGHL